MMRVLSFLLTIALVCSATVAFAQTKSTVPRGPEILKVEFTVSGWYIRPRSTEKRDT